MKTSAVPCVLLLAAACLAQSVPRIVDLTASDGQNSRQRLSRPAKAGPGVLLLHQGNGQRKGWDPLAEALASRGIHVLTDNEQRQKAVRENAELKLKQADQK